MLCLPINRLMRPFMRIVPAVFLGLSLGVSACLTSIVSAEPVPLAPAATPADNPLKGLVPYADADVERFPHSLEFDYVKLSDLMTGRDTFDWQPLETLLDKISSRGCQAVLRIWIEYPGQPSGLPQYLRDEGVKVTEWTNSKENPPKKNFTPDYEDQRLVVALESFLAEFGRRYDGDPRLGYLTAGLLGQWGEWHDWPREELFASQATQKRVLDAYTKAFTRTPVLLRYPAGSDHDAHVANSNRPFGYHDDSFAWGTLDTGKKGDSWFYMPLLTAAGEEAVNKWKTQPIGGEIRPEVWGQIFDAKPKHKQAQDFAECVRQTHATWLMDSGLFDKKPSADRIQRAKAQVQRMGYDFYVQSAQIVRPQPEQIKVTLAVVNNGVAPFYHDWALELAALSSSGEVLKTYPVDWKLTGILPSAQPHSWVATLPAKEMPENAAKLALRAINPLANGKTLKFANADQDADLKGWLTVGTIKSPDA